jgi:hypothetical protein
MREFSDFIFEQGLMDTPPVGGKFPLSIGLNTSLCEGSCIYRKENHNYNAEYQQLQQTVLRLLTC